MGGLSHKSGAIARPVFGPRCALDLHLEVASVGLALLPLFPELKEPITALSVHCPDASRQHRPQSQWFCGIRESGLHKRNRNEMIRITIAQP
jgi:hypothetical protein